MRIVSEYWTPRPTDLSDWSHSGMTALPDGRIVFADAGTRNLVLLTGDGETQFVPFSGTEAHDLEAVVDDGRILLWVADPGAKGFLEHGTVGHHIVAGALELVTLAGETLRRIEREPGWRPTSVAAVDPHAGLGSELWVADGYESSRVFRMDSHGQVLQELDGTATGIAFNTPHGVAIDRRSVDPRVVIADRGNRRLVILDQAGEVVEVVAHENLHSPSGLTFDDEHLFVSQLHGGVIALDRRYDIVDELDHVVAMDDAWPNQSVDGHTQPPDLSPSRLRSPHGIVHQNGRLYLTEWFLGGRHLILAPAVDGRGES